MILPLITLCANLGTPEVACQAFMGNPQVTKEACEINIVQVGLPNLMARYPGAVIVGTECYAIGEPA